MHNQHRVQAGSSRNHLPKQLVAFLLFISISLTAMAKNYYISSSTGNDSYTSTQAQNQSTPWKSISKLNSFALAAGDIVYFKNGETFYGTIIPNTGGITYTAYGSGVKPIITGLTSISSWTSVGSNIWEASVPAGLAKMNMVVINNALVPMGRYPNAKTTNDGYLTYESASGSSSITDNQLSSSPNWNGGELLVRRTNYASDRAKITGHSGTTINFSTYSGGHAFISGYGYFIQNHASTLDQNGEWYYNPSTKKIRIYYTSTPPTVQVSTLANLFKADFTSKGTQSNITIRGLNFRGSEEIIMPLTYCNNFTIDNCDFAFAGTNAVEYKYVTGLTLKNSTISDINMIGVYEYDSKTNNNITIQNNTIRRIGINPGMMSNAYGEAISSTALNVFAQNLLIQENVIDSVGYVAIGLKKSRNNQAVRKNVISNYCMIKNDGGAIYNSGLRGDPVATNIVIESNIISKGGNATGGTIYPNNKHTRAIYLDATSTGVQVLNNTIFDAWDGIYISQAQYITIRGNTIYNTGNYKPGALNYYSGALVIADGFDGYQHTRYNTITKNVLFAKEFDQLLYYQTDRYNGVGQIGVVDSNYYANPQSDIPHIMTNTTAASTQTIFSLPEWRTTFPNYDRNSKMSPRTIPQFTVNSQGANKAPNEQFNSNISGVTAESSPQVHSLSWDNTSKVTGTGSAKLTSSVTSSKLTSLFQIVGAVTSGKKYLLKFKTRATKPGAFQTRILQYTGCYCINSSIKRGSFDTDLKQHEILMDWTDASQSNAALFIEFTQNSSTVYIDDIQFQEVTVSPTNVDDYHRFVYNPTNSNQTISLAANYISVEGTVYNTGSITLAPFSSKVLLKDGGQVTPPPAAPPVAGRPVATAGTPAFSCGGTSTSVPVSATGGSAPYTGTGNFNTNAGKGTLRLSFPTTSTINTVLNAPIGAISTGKYYVLRVTTLGTTTKGQINGLIRKTAAPSNALVSTQTKSFGTSRVDHEFRFTPTASDGNASFHLEVAQSSGTVYIDNIAFFEATSAGALISNNLFSNSQFESNITGIYSWSSNNNHVAAWDNTGKINNTNYYTVTDAAGLKSTVGVIVKQSATPVAAYVSLQGTNKLTVTANGGTFPYTGTGTFTAKTGLNTFTVKDANGCSAIANFTLGANKTSTATGTAGESMSTEGLQLQKDAALRSLTISTFPNPAITEIGLLVEGGSNEKINIVVMSMDGRTVYQTIGTSNKTYKFGNSFVPGVYIIKVVQGDKVQTTKVVKS